MHYPSWLTSVGLGFTLVNPLPLSPRRGSATLLEDALNEKSGFAACLQETWRQGFENVLFGSWRFIGSGPEQLTGRGARGVGIALGYKAQVAWEHAGQPLWVESNRVLAVRLMVQTGGHSSGPLGVLLVSGYAPTSAHTEAEHSSYLAAMERALSHAQPIDIVVAGVDANASIGRGSLTLRGGGSSEATQMVGPHGSSHINAAGRRLRTFITFMETHQLAALTSFFRKPHYDTWSHPRNHHGYQLDHFPVSRRHLGRFTDASACCGFLKGSDHRAVGCKLRFIVKLARKPAPPPRRMLLSREYASLLDEDGAQQFAHKVVQKLAGVQVSSSLSVTADGLVGVCSHSTLTHRAH